MSDPTTSRLSRVGAAWWAPTMGRMTMRARVATAVVAAALVLLIVIVWTSPGNSPVGPALAAPPPTAEELRLSKENAAMREELRTSRSQAQGLRSALQQEQDARTKGEEARAAAAAAAEAAGPGTSPRTTSGKASTAGKKATTTRGTGAANPSNPTQPSGPGAPVTTLPTTPSRAELLDPAQRYFGLFTSQAPFNFATYDEISTKVGRSPSLVGYFSGWDKPFRADAVTRSWERGALPMLTWQSRPSDAPNDETNAPGFELPTVTAGAHDDYLRQYARDIVALGLPLAIRLDHEMNGVWYPWSEMTSSGASINGNSPGDFVRMWQHVHDLFEAEGANAHVIWVWSPNIVNNLPAVLATQTRLAALYPGDDYVDWVGISGYNRPPYVAANNSTFNYTYGKTLDQIRQLTDKKILLAEVGASETGGKKPAWVTSFFRGFAAPANDDIIGFAWFNLAVSTYSAGQLVTNDWRIDSRRNSLDAFITGLNDPAARFGGAVLPGGPIVEDVPEPAPVVDEPVATSTPTPTPTVAPTAAATATPAATPTATTRQAAPTPSGTATPRAPSPTPTSSSGPTSSPTPTATPQETR